MCEQLVSVVIATHKREKSLERALNSLSEQTYKNFEIVIVDDNAQADLNNRVSGVVSAFSNVFKNINVSLIVNTENKGSAETRNIGIRASKGEYITFLDDDDVYLPEKIENQVTEMIKADADYSITDLYLYNKNDKLIGKRVRNYIKSFDEKSLLKYHLMYHLTGTDVLMFKRDYLLNIGGFPPIDIGDEFYLMNKAIEGKGKLLYIPNCFVKAYVHNGTHSLSTGENKIIFENILFEFKKKYFNELNKKEINYIKMRHFAVLAFAELREKNLFSFVKYAFISFFSSPFDCLKLLFDLK